MFSNHNDSYTADTLEICQDVPRHLESHLRGINHYLGYHFILESILTFTPAISFLINY